MRNGRPTTAEISYPHRNDENGRITMMKTEVCNKRTAKRNNKPASRLCEAQY
ncbi:MAG TPA: hypothetical protein VJ279_04975 [Hanamia sp.]|nr:hypothetical protein [Hanamia sp.]